MSNKYTFWDLCNTYNKIEVPIIQRDYAQGRNTVEVQKLRNKFVDNYLIKSILKGENIQLDFVYGSILEEDKVNNQKKTFIPLDGQQRLTTLFLLHFFVAIKEHRLNEIKDVLLKFTYETRPSARDFCKLLLDMEAVNNLTDIKSEIEDSVWFNEEWKGDPTVSGMLNMLDTFAKNENLQNAPNGLLDKLISDNTQLVSFYFTDLDQFGLTENLYIRMNARGKMLTEFENFKSEFSKIINYDHELSERVKDKIEYDWVNNLWEYRTKDSYIVDQPFMNFLSFITEMLYFKDAEFRGKISEGNFLDFSVLKDVYSSKENLKFLIFSLDFIKEIKNYNEGILWDGESIHSILKNILQNKRDINQLFILFLTLSYCYQEKPRINLIDFIRVVRNLITNTADNSRREWPRLIASLQNLISDKNVFEVLSNLEDDNKLLGFSVEQRKEEQFKAKNILSLPNFKSTIFKIEDNNNFKGRISNILKSPFAESDTDYNTLELETIAYSQNALDLLNLVYLGYEEISANDFNPIWGNLLTSSLYKQTFDSRLIYSGTFKSHPAIMAFAKDYKLSKLDLSNYIIKIQKDFISNLHNEIDDLSQVRNVKNQLYLYYIIHERIYKKPYYSFFKNFNFGWLEREAGYKSLFTAGIEGSTSFNDTNPIFQVYKQLFRFNLGINPNNSLDIESDSLNIIPNPFELLKKWAKEGQNKHE